MPTPYDGAIGSLLKKARDDAGMSQDELAQVMAIDAGLGWQQSTVAKVENGKRALTGPELWFLCQHFTREAVWLPELTKHANGATRIDHLELLSADPLGAAQHMSRLIDMPVGKDSDGAPRVESGAGRGAFVFVDRARLLARHPNVPLAGLPDEGAVVLSLRVADAAKTTAALAGAGIASGAGVVKVPPFLANGVLIEFAEG